MSNEEKRKKAKSFGAKRKKRVEGGNDNWTADYTKEKHLSDLFTIALHSLKRGEDLETVHHWIETICNILVEDGVVHKRRTMADMNREHYRTSCEARARRWQQEKEQT